MENEYEEKFRFIWQTIVGMLSSRSILHVHTITATTIIIVIIVAIVGTTTPTRKVNRKCFWQFFLPCYRNFPPFLKTTTSLFFTIQSEMERHVSPTKFLRSPFLYKTDLTITKITRAVTMMHPRKKKVKINTTPYLLHSSIAFLKFPMKSDPIESTTLLIMCRRRRCS